MSELKKPRVGQLYKAKDHSNIICECLEVDIVKRRVTILHPVTVNPNQVLDFETFFSKYIPLEDAQAAEIEQLAAKVAELEADNARMREALEDIRNSGGGNLYSEDAYTFIDIAREALKGKG